MSAVQLWSGLAAVSGWYLTGLAVTVALVVYPAFARVGAREWAGYHAAHQRAVALAVGPAWLAEGVATAGLLVTGGLAGGWTAVSAVGNAVAAAATVALTVVGAVPRHTALTGGFDAAEHRRLRSSHRLRTLAWAVAATSATAALACAG